MSRAIAMGRSVGRALRAAGADASGAALVRAAFEAAMVPRLRDLDDDHHPAYLHPGRTVLVILRDIGWIGQAPLAAAALFESEDDALRVPPPALAAAVDEEVRDGLAGIPLPGDPRAAERLAGLAHPWAVVALAERLDQLRHLHLRPDLRERWQARFDETSEAWLPFAQRTHETLGRRYAHWARVFGRRLRQLPFV